MNRIGVTAVAPEAWRPPQMSADRLVLKLFDIF